MNTSKITITAIKERLIKARDSRIEIIEKNTTKHSTFCVLKINIPSYPKNNNSSAFLLRFFTSIIEKIYTPITTQFYANEAGDFYLYEMSHKAIPLKKQLIQLEAIHPLGRFIDLDVYEGTRILSRLDFNHQLRTCYLCEQPAQQCARLMTHSPEHLQKKIDEKIIHFIQNALEKATADALRKELFLSPKFGLVTPNDSGIHHDMNSHHFIASIKALTPYFKQCASHGFELDIDLEKVRNLGIIAEQAMFNATNNINTHKGAIFIFGAVLPFLALGIYQQHPLSEIITTMKLKMKALLAHDFSNLSDKQEHTSGEKIYLTYGMKGIRGEVLGGFQSIFSWYPQTKWNDYQKLCALMSKLDDTTIIKRKNLQTLKLVQQDMQAFIKQDPFKQEHYDTLSNQYKKEGISPGGSADLLALVFLFERVHALLKEPTL